MHIHIFPMENNFFHVPLITEIEIFVMFQNFLAADHHVTAMTEEVLSAADTEDYSNMPNLFEDNQVSWAKSILRM